METEVEAFAQDYACSSSGRAGRAMRIAGNYLAELRSTIVQRVFRTSIFESVVFDPVLRRLPLALRG